LYLKGFGMKKQDWRPLQTLNMPLRCLRWESDTRYRPLEDKYLQQLCLKKLDRKLQDWWRLQALDISQMELGQKSCRSYWPPKGNCSQYLRLKKLDRKLHCVEWSRLERCLGSDNRIRLLLRARSGSRKSNRADPKSMQTNDLICQWLCLCSGGEKKPSLAAEQSLGIIPLTVACTNICWAG
jgi:hypothetical protein